MKNNEYFSNITSGYTFAASSLNTTLLFYPVDNVKIEAGVHMLMNYGLQKLSRLSPLFRFQYFAGKNLSLVMGTIYSGHNHELFEPIYKFENFMEDPPETGLQLLYKSERIKSDLYLNWMHYIGRYELSEKEQFSIGWTGRLRLSAPGRQSELYIPVQLLARHTGSQTDTLGPDQSLMNFATGLGFSKKANNFIEEYGGRILFFSYRDISKNKLLPFQAGKGIYPSLYAYGKWADICIAYWWANEFMAPFGETLFTSVSDLDYSMVFPERQLFLARLNLHHKIAEGISLGAMFDAYYDILGTGFRTKNKSEFNYSYSFYISFDNSYSLLKHRKTY